MVFVASLRDEKISVLYLEIEFKRNDNLLRSTAKSFTNLRYCIVKKFLVGLVKFTLVFVCETLIYCTICNVDIIDVCVLFLVIVNDSKHIDIGNCMAHNLALGGKIIQCYYPLFVFFGTFKLQF